MKFNPEDFANWGAYFLEDIGILEIDRAIGSIREYGLLIRNELTDGGDKLSPYWSEVATRLWSMSPAFTTPSPMMSVLCQLVCAKLVIEDRLGAKKTK
jgi:hypothetical protein